jgi:hypothetical protein
MLQGNLSVPRGHGHARRCYDHLLQVCRQLPYITLSGCNYTGSHAMGQVLGLRSTCLLLLSSRLSARRFPGTMLRFPPIVLTEPCGEGVSRCDERITGLTPDYLSSCGEPFKPAEEGPLQSGVETRGILASCVAVGVEPAPPGIATMSTWGDGKTASTPSVPWIGAIMRIQNRVAPRRQNGSSGHDG